MFLNRSAQYTLQALLYLARQPRNGMVMAREIAERLALPPHYLAKLMYPLSRAGWVDSMRGRHGGYRLRDAARALTLVQVLDCVQGANARAECLLGLKVCGDDDACVVHCQWRPVRDELRAYLECHTLGEISEGRVAFPESLEPQPLQPRTRRLVA